MKTIRFRLFYPMYVTFLYEHRHQSRLLFWLATGVVYAKFPKKAFGANHPADFGEITTIRVELKKFISCLKKGLS